MRRKRITWVVTVESDLPLSVLRKLAFVVCDDRVRGPQFVPVANANLKECEPLPPRKSTRR